MGCHHKPRETRETIGREVRIRTEEGWTDAVVGNASSRGLLLLTGRPPGRSAVIEIRRRSLVIVGRVVWSQAGRCGVVTQEKVDIAALKRDAPATPGPVRERRAVTRPGPLPRRATPAERAEAARAWGRRFEFGFAACLLAGSALVIAGAAGAALKAPAERVQLALAAARTG